MKIFLILSLVITLLSPFISFAEEDSINQIQKKEWTKKYKISNEYEFFCRDDAPVHIKEFGKNNKYLLVLCPDISASSLYVWKKNKKGVYDNIVSRLRLWEGYYKDIIWREEIIVKGSYFTVEYESSPGDKINYYTFKESGDDILLHKISFVELNDDTMKEEVSVPYQNKKGYSPISITNMPELIREVYNQ